MIKAFGVKVNACQQMKMEEILKLWSLINEHISSILENRPPKKYPGTADTTDLRSLNCLAADHVRYMKRPSTPDNTQIF